MLETVSRYFYKILTALVLFFPLSTEAKEYRNCTNISSAGAPIAGEKYDCDECYTNFPGIGNATGCVKCGTVSLRIPAGADIIDYRRTASRSGWAAWLDEINIIPQPNNSTLFSTKLKNWSHNQDIRICLYVETK